MYIRITSRCNMSCDHCCYSCSSKGEDMTLETFKECLEYGDEYISIGGGEPTVHPEFYHFLILAIAEADYVWLATNGKETGIALTLAKLAKSGVIGCDLSQDVYHDPIEEKVIDAFTVEQRPGDYISRQNSNDGRGIRNVMDKEINSGRCDFGEEGCPCDDMVVQPNGDMYQCGCNDSPKIGNILTDPPNCIEARCHKESIDG